MAGAGGFRRSAGLGSFRSWQAIITSSLAPHRCGSCSSPFVPCLTFAPGQEKCEEKLIGPMVGELQAKGQLFYGIEVLARTHKGPIELNFNDFLPVLPVFVSVVWHSLRFWDVEPVGDVEALVLCKQLAERVPALPHITCYRMSKQRMDQLLDLELKNIAALRGDDIDPKQDFKNSVDMTQFAKCRHGDKISISVAGFPDGYNPAERSPPDMARNMDLMKAKIAAGADCIITQMCYKPDVIIKYVESCRAAGIKEPILIGIMSHDTYMGYKNMQKRGEAELPPKLEEEVEDLQCQYLADPEKNKDLIINFFVRVNVQIISQILAARDDIWGVVFFTLNRFDNVHRVLKELHALGLFKKP